MKEKFLALLCLVFIAFQGFAQYPDTAAYAEYVFPMDMNKYPIVIVKKDFTAQTKRPSRNYGKKNEKNIETFIAKQNNVGKYECHYIEESELGNYPANKYRYVIKEEIFLLGLDDFSNELYAIGFRFHDRNTAAEYKISADLWAGSKMIKREPGYPDRYVNPDTFKPFSKKLLRTMDYMNYNSSEMKVREYLRKRQTKSLNKRRRVAIGTLSVLVVGAALTPTIFNF